LPVLVFIHGVGSSTLGSFGDLQLDQRDLWSALERHFTGGIYAFEHRTLSEGPIENALQLLAALPDGIRVSFVAHSRGGLVADLLCLESFHALVDRYAADLPGTGDADEKDRQRVGASSTPLTPASARSCGSWPPMWPLARSSCSATCGSPARRRGRSWRAAIWTSSSPVC
jgi:pimeloyl-ACP methyl ester carboxylesterase